MIKEFIKNKRAVYYTATKAGINKNIELWGQQALTVFAPEMNTLFFKRSMICWTFLENTAKERERLLSLMNCHT